MADAQASAAVARAPVCPKSVVESLPSPAVQQSLRASSVQQSEAVSTTIHARDAPALAADVQPFAMGSGICPEAASEVVEVDVHALVSKDDLAAASGFAEAAKDMSAISQAHR